MRPLVLLRPEPGLSASRSRAEAMGMAVIAAPLFTIEAVEWERPAADAFDALLLTSGNTLRRAGALGDLAGLPVHAVGEATAATARAMGLTVVTVGERGARELLEGLPPGQRLLHIGGEDRTDTTPRGHAITTVTVYAAVPIETPDLPDLSDTVVAVHSPRAGRRLAELARGKAGARVAAIGQPAAEACGPGWETVEAAPLPNDAALLSLAARLCQTGG
ncbi:uroporphyrinogen-III synthase [Sphingomonas sp. ASV193]|uniref:uroporphyrinogen-III synthase n=1 Tax=Sphingomonas sp. ASV193 TaxID=3144405 RepID=UPI0032E8C35C